MTIIDNNNEESPFWDRGLPKLMRQTSSFFDDPDTSPNFKIRGGRVKDSPLAAQRRIEQTNQRMMKAAASAAAATPKKVTAIVDEEGSRTEPEEEEEEEQQIVQRIIEDHHHHHHHHQKRQGAASATAAAPKEEAAAAPSRRLPAHVLSLAIPPFLQDSGIEKLLINEKHNTLYIASPRKKILIPLTGQKYVDALAVVSRTGHQDGFCEASSTGLGDYLFHTVFDRKELTGSYR
jgi:hypothetical protein